MDTEVFGATNHGGTQGVLETDGVTLLEDDLGATPPTLWECNQGGNPNDDYGASDLYFGIQDDSESVAVCGHSRGDDAAAPCTDDDEILQVGASYDQCAGNMGGSNADLAIAIYYEL